MQKVRCPKCGMKMKKGGLYRTRKGVDKLYMCFFCGTKRAVPARWV